MPITLTSASVKQLVIDYEAQVVTAVYAFIDASSVPWGDTASVYFFLNMPGEPPGGYPQNWFQLPNGYLPTLISLQNAAEATIVNRFLD